ncbi:hypothetical protein [Ornithinibacillus sp. 179-J 7C1 HS]|uniref:hypothetical protein n=1 Tax=Ornithinibacillus sp. 179-J 7C1 HS TaxID=3142384 RepID=UPI00399FA137
MNYTSEMEKAMQTSHHIGYAEYCRNLDKRLEVEKKRQQEYHQCKQMIAEIDNTNLK